MFFSRVFALVTTLDAHNITQLLPILQPQIVLVDNFYFLRQNGHNHMPPRTTLIPSSNVWLYLQQARRGTTIGIRSVGVIQTILSWTHCFEVAWILTVLFDYKFYFHTSVQNVVMRFFHVMSCWDDEAHIDFDITYM